VDQELLLRHEYLVAENRMTQLRGRVRLPDAERAELSEIRHRLGHKALRRRGDNRAAGYHPGRRLVAHKFDGSPARRAPGRPPIDRAVEQLIVRMAALVHFRTVLHSRPAGKPRSRTPHIDDDT
jgi:putative transposase